MDTPPRVPRTPRRALEGLAEEESEAGGPPPQALNLGTPVRKAGTALFTTPGRSSAGFAASPAAGRMASPAMTPRTKMGKIDVEIHSRMHQLDRLLGECDGER
jgi:hypothetical protein